MLSEGFHTYLRFVIHHRIIGEHPVLLVQVEEDIGGPCDDIQCDRYRFFCFNPP